MAWVQVVVAIVMMIVGELLRPKPKLQDAKPSSLGEFNFPTADASRVIGFFVGTCKFRGMNTGWYGDLVIEALKKKVKTGLFSSKRITVGYHYFLGVQMVAGYGPVDELVGFQVDDKPVTLLDLVDHGDYWEFRINEPTLMDADDPPSGVSGKVRIYKGTPTQPADPYLAAQWGEAEIPAFRPLCYMVLESFYVGNSETPPVFTPILRRCPNTLGLLGGKHVVNGDANIAAVAYLIMTDMLYGLKISPASINVQSFIDCGDVLYSENLGISMQFDSARPGKDWLGEVLRYADAVVYPDPVTGLYTMKMARADYDIDDLDIFDDDDIEEDSFEFSRASWEDTKNNVVINYTDRNADFNVRPVQYQDLANIFSRGNVIDSESIDFLGISNPASATVIATRVGKTLASPLARGGMKLKPGRGYTLRPGSVFRLNKVNRGILDLVVRVGEISYGTLDDPRVSVTVTEDVFAVKAISYVPPTPTQWTPPGNPSTAVTIQTIIELPKMQSPNDTRYPAVMAVRVNSQSTTYDVWTDTGSGFKQSNVYGEYTPTGLLLNSYPASNAVVDEVGFTIYSGVNMTIPESITEAEWKEGQNLVYVNGEIMAWREIVDNNDGSWTVKGVMRGVFDTVPKDHPMGTRVWFLSDGATEVSPTGYGSDITLATKLLPHGVSGFSATIALLMASAMGITLNSRAARPIVPGRIRINGNTVADTLSVAGAFSVSWAHRNRNYTSGVLSQDDASVTPEDGVVYRLRAYNVSGNTLLAEGTGDGNAASIQLTGTTRVRLELVAIRGTLESWVAQTATFDYDPAGGLTNQVTIDSASYVLDGGGA